MVDLSNPDNTAQAIEETKQRLNGELHALAGICPHAGGPIGQGNIQDNLVICPWHEWAYDCRTGENDFDPAIKLDRFPVKAEGDDILIDPEVRN